MAFNFDGTSFVGIDDDAVGDGQDTTQPLDAALEACLHSNQIHIAKGLDCASWEPYSTGASGSTGGDQQRPYASLDWMTIAPPVRLPIMPGQTGFEFRYDYRVRDVGDGLTTNTLDYFLRFQVPGLGTTEVELASADWTAKVTTVSFNQPIEAFLRVPVLIYGRSEIYDADVIDNGTGTPYIRGLMVSTIYTAGDNTSEPNETSPEIQATKATDAAGQETWHDHIAYESTPSLSAEGMVLNPPVPPRNGTVTVAIHALSYFQTHGFNYRPIFDPVNT